MSIDESYNSFRLSISYTVAMKLVVVRHAPTEYNEKGIINGRHDDNLSAKGKQAVKDLKEHDFTVIYSSPLKRATETAMPIAETHNVSINVDRRLIEVDFGSFTSKNWQSLIPTFGVDSRGLLDTYTYDLREYGGESADQVKERVKSFLADLQKDPTQVPLIVTHGGILRWFHLLCSQKKVSGFPNASIHTFEI